MTFSDVLMIMDENDELGWTLDNVKSATYNGKSIELGGEDFKVEKGDVIELLLQNGKVIRKEI